MISMQASARNPDDGKPSGSRCDSLSLQPYFRVKGKYPESSSSLARRANVALATQGAFVGADGYVCFQFLIDDQGKLQMLQILETDAKFNRNKFPPLLVNTLEQFVKSLDQWNHRRYKDKPLCYSGYLSFKIEDGHVSQVSP
jgi:hypothetical protein